LAAHVSNGWGTGAGDWSIWYSQYLARSSAQSARTLKLYQEVLELVSRGQLAPTVFQDYLPRFAQARGAEYTARLSELSARFLTDLLRISADYSRGQEEPSSTVEPEIPPPHLDPSDSVKWFQQLTEYAGQLNARALRAYRTQLDRVAAGDATPGQLQQSTSERMARRLPGYVEQAGQLYFGLLNGLNEIRSHYEQDYFLGVLATLSGDTATAEPEPEPDVPVVLRLSAPLGETVSASLSVANATDAPTTIRCNTTEVRRSDGVGPAFSPGLTIASNGVELKPGEEGRLRLSLRLDEAKYDVDAPYTGTLYILGQSDVPAEVQLRITATRSAEVHPKSVQ
jgi:hypothetical protein